MDMDLKRGTVHKHFVLDKHFNIGHYIKDDCDYTELTVDRGIPHLDIVISGNPSSGSSEFC
jgi:MinD-like ATPase involved in chromosome partitioning or flagellar assembly